MPDTSENQDLLNQWRAGDEQAARLLFDRYVDRLLALARRRISQRLAGRIDPEDVVQSVFRTFFHRAREGQFTITDQDDLCKLLVRITVHKTLRQVAFHRAGKRNMSREMGRSNETQQQAEEVFDREPTPEEAVTFLDQLEHLLNQLRPQDRRILEMRFQGYSNDEIAKELGTYDRNIRRVIERVRGLAEQEGFGA